MRPMFVICMSCWNTAIILMKTAADIGWAKGICYLI